MSNRVGIVLLCEDARHEQFIREFLRQKGRFARRVFPDGYKRRVPGGAKPNNSFVVGRAPQEIKEARVAPPKRALVIVIDGDTRGYASRCGEIARELKAQKMAALGDKERIALVIPCRNIETWIHHFRGNETNETEEFGSFYPKATYDALPQAQAFADFVSDGAAAEVADLPALDAARGELRRLNELMKQSP